MIPGSVFVEVSTSAWQCGHIMCVGWGPNGTTVVTICGPPVTVKSLVRLSNTFYITLRVIYFFYLIKSFLLIMSCYN